MATNEYMPTAWRDLVAEGRRATFLVSPQILAEISKAHHAQTYYITVKNALPDDAKVVDVRHAPESGCWAVEVVSTDFEPVPEGAELPVLSPAVHVIAESSKEPILVTYRCGCWTTARYNYPARCGSHDEPVLRVQKPDGTEIPEVPIVA